MSYAAQAIGGAVVTVTMWACAAAPFVATAAIVKLMRDGRLPWRWYSKAGLVIVSPLAPVSFTALGMLTVTASSLVLMLAPFALGLLLIGWVSSRGKRPAPATRTAGYRLRVPLDDPTDLVDVGGNFWQGKRDPSVRRFYFNELDERMKSPPADIFDAKVYYEMSDGLFYAEGLTQRQFAEVMASIEHDLSNPDDDEEDAS